MNHDEYVKRRDAITVGFGPLYVEVSADPKAQQAIDELVLAVIGENAKNPYGKDPVMIDYGQKLADYGEFIRLSQRSIVKGGE